MSARALRGRLLWFPDEYTAHYDPDGALLMDGGTIRTAGPARQILPSLPPGVPVDDVRPHLVMPGFIDTHIHYPQTRVIASYGAQLIDWLNRYTFPEERKFSDPVHAATVAEYFLGELLRNGTTTAAVYCTVHPQSVDAFFAQSERHGTRMIAGKVMMDRNAPDGLRDDAESGYRDSEALLRRWHGRGRQSYAITPRFAITSTDAQLAAAGALARAYPGAYVQTHLSENHAEIAMVRDLFPNDASYTDVYARHGLLGRRTLLGHCIHLSAQERATLAGAVAVAVFCPTSNLFLGSGLFDAAATRAAGVRTAIASDVGGGTSYSMLRTAAEAYKVLQLQGQSLSPYGAFHAITRGNAHALGLEDQLGALASGYDADVVVLDSAATPAMAHRMEAAHDLADELFLLLTLGDDRAVAATYVGGVRA